MATARTERSASSRSQVPAGAESCGCPAACPRPGSPPGPQSSSYLANRGADSQPPPWDKSRDSNCRPVTDRSAAANAMSGRRGGPESWGRGRERTTCPKASVLRGNVLDGANRVFTESGGVSVWNRRDRVPVFGLSGTESLSSSSAASRPPVRRGRASGRRQKVSSKHTSGQRAQRGIDLVGGAWRGMRTEGDVSARTKTTTSDCR